MDKILIVEDNIELSDALCRNLQEEGFAVSAASCLAQAHKYLDNGTSLCLLDLNLPDGDGFTFCRYLSENTAIPIILLTVRDDAQDMVRGLSIGADDYVTKPFLMDVLVSRIRAVLRRVRNRKPQDDNLYCGDVFINKKASKVYKKDCPVELTPNEYQLLLLLLEHKNQTITREQILEKLWDVDGNYVNDNTLTTLVKRLRQKVEDHPQMPKMVTLSLCMLLSFGFLAVFTASDISNAQAENMNHFDVNITLGTGERIEDTLLAELKAVPGVQETSVYARANCAVWLSASDQSAEFLQAGGFDAADGYIVQRDGRYRVLLNVKFWSPPTAHFFIHSNQNNGRIASPNHDSTAILFKLSYPSHASA